MGIFIKETGIKVKQKDLEFLYGMMEKDTKVNGKIIKLTGQG